MVKQIEVITKKLTKLINQKAQKENDLIRIQEDINNFNDEIISLENEAIRLMREHQKNIKNTKKKSNISQKTEED